MRITGSRGIDDYVGCDRSGDPLGRPPLGRREIIPIIPIIPMIPFSR